MNSRWSSAHPAKRNDRLALLPLHLLLVIAALAAAVASQGGYYPAGRFLVAVLAGAALLAGLRVRPWTRADAGLVLVSGAGLAAWAAARAAADGKITAAIPTLLTLACMVAVLLVVQRADAAQRELCAAAAVGIGVLVAVSGWIGVAWRIQPWALAADGRLWRAASTLTYANAAAAVLASLSLLSIALLVARPRSLVRAAAVYLLLVGLGATLSRGGLLALLAGLVVLSLSAGPRATARTAAPPVLGAAVALGTLLPLSPATAQPRPVLAVLGLAAGMLTAVGLGRLPRPARAVALLAGVAVVGIVFIAQLKSSDAIRIVADSRANLASPSRTETARVALRLVTDRPLVGVGPGRAAFPWTTPDGRVVTGRYAHNEYLQVLVELGAIGLVLLLCLLLAVAVTVRRGRADAHSPVIWAGATAALAALVVHSALDFLWQLPVIPLIGGLLVGLAGPTTQEPIGSRSAAEEQ